MFINSNWIISRYTFFFEPRGILGILKLKNNRDQLVAYCNKKRDYPARLRDSSVLLFALI